MQIERQVTIDAPADEVWKVLAHRFGDVSKWASSVSRSTYEPSTSGDTVGSERFCATSFGDLKETIVRYDEAGKSLSYRAEGLPSVVTEGVNTWAVHPSGNNHSVVSMRAEMTLKPGIGLVVGPVMKLQLGKALGQVVDELKYYVETGQLHPRKIEARAKEAKRSPAR